MSATFFIQRLETFFFSTFLRFFLIFISFISYYIYDLERHISVEQATAAKLRTNAMLIHGKFEYSNRTRFMSALHNFTRQGLIDKVRSCLMVVTHSQETCTSFLHQIFVQVYASSAHDTSNKKGRSWTKQITFSILSVDHSMGTQFLLE